MTDYADLRKRLDERRVGMESRNESGQLYSVGSLVDPLCAEASAAIAALVLERDEERTEKIELQRKLWTIVKERRDVMEQLAEAAAQDLTDACERGWNSHLPTLEEIQAAGPYVRVGWDETLEEATQRARLSPPPSVEGSVTSAPETPRS